MCTAVSNIITTIDHTPHITDILRRYVGREVIGHLSSLSVRTGDIEEDVHQTINDDVELKETLCVLHMEEDLDKWSQLFSPHTLLHTCTIILSPTLISDTPNSAGTDNKNS